MKYAEIKEEKEMKRLIALSLAIIMMFALAACTDRQYEVKIQEQSHEFIGLLLHFIIEFDMGIKNLVMLLKYSEMW